MNDQKNNGQKGTALIYCRTATSSRDAPTRALDEQADACITLATSLGYTVGRVTREIASGSGDDLWKRPLFARDWADLEAGKFGALIVSSPDRLTRDHRRQRFLAMACEQLGVTLAFVTGDYLAASGLPL
jgi:DNA invertase Pin-like site-specific DNA recombinase